MAVEAKKDENATVTAEKTASPSEIDLVRAELEQTRRAYTASNTNFKRAQQKITQLEAERDGLKEKLKAPKEPSNATVKDAPSITVSASAANSEPLTSTQQSPAQESHDHEMEWVPPFCGEHGCENKLFVNQVRCANDKCRGPIGSEAYAKHKLKACPLCGENAGYKPVEGYTTQHDDCTGPDCKVKS